MTIETVLGVGAVIVLLAVVAFTFRQGLKVRKPPEGVPPERFPGG